jgi:class 3 adenylate cyclase
MNLMIEIPGYRVQALLYESAGSSVYQGEREEDNQPVILKLLNEEASASPEKIEQFEQEYEIARNLNLSGVVGVYSLEKYRHAFVIVLEDVGSESPDGALTQDTPSGEQLAATQKEMEGRADSTPENFLHRYLLIEAETARLSGRAWEAMGFYDQAIKAARENGFIQDEALANELAAKFWVAKGKEEFAGLYLKKAHDGYLLAGARSKVEDLEAEYPQLLAGVSSGPHLKDSLTPVTDNSSLQALLEGQTEITNAYSRFVPRAIFQLLGKESITQVELGDQTQQEMTVMFSDIRSFTSLSEQMTPQENFKFINAYLSRVSPVIREHRGFIDKFIGDAIMALFPGGVNDAIQAAIAMQQEVTRYNLHLEAQGHQPIRVGVGLHTGSVMFGTVGEVKRMEGTVISDAVNLTSRLEKLTKLYGASIVVSEDTLFSLERPASYNFRFLDKVKVKGKTHSVSVFEIFDGDVEEKISLKLQTRTDFEKGLLHYHSQEFREAITYFNNVLALNPEDRATQVYLRQATHCLWIGREAIEDEMES